MQQGKARRNLNLAPPQNGRRNLSYGSYAAVGPHRDVLGADADRRAPCSSAHTAAELAQQQQGQGAVPGLKQAGN